MLGSMKQYQANSILVSSVLSYWLSQVNGTFTANEFQPIGSFTDSADAIYILGGYEYTGASGPASSFAVVKFNSTGSIVWAYEYYNYNASSVESPYTPISIAGDSSFLYVATDSQGLPHVGPRVIKISQADGSLQQDNYWNTSSFSTTINTTGVALSPNGSLILATKSTNDNYAGLVSISNTGSVNWSATIGPSPSPTYSPASRPAVDSNNYSYILSNPTISSNLVVRVDSFDSSGNPRWARLLSNYYSANYSYMLPVDIQVDSSNYVYVLANASYYVSSGPEWIVLLKYDSNGILQWQRTIQPSSGYAIGGDQLSIDGSNNIYVCGGSESSGPVFSTLIAKYNPSGVLQWQREMLNNTSTSGDSSQTITNLATGNVIIVPTSGLTNATVMNLNPTGGDTGTFLVNNTSYTYSTSSFTELAGNIANLHVATSTTNPFVSTNFGNVTVTEAFAITPTTTTIKYIGN